MKKIILLLVSVLILSFYQTVIGAEQSALFLDDKAISGNADISKGEHTITAVADGDMVFIAVYEDGMLKAVSTNKSLTYNFSSSGIEVKLFNWDKYMTPVSDVVCVKQNDIPETVYAGEAACEPDEDEDFNEYLVKLEVVKVDGKITEIRNIEGYEYSGKQTSKTNLSFLKKAADKLVDKIIKKQSTKVDAVSGATCASYAIMDAVDAALKSDPISTPKPTVTASPEPTIDDGTYSGTAQALGKYLNYMIDVDVTVKDGAVTKIEDKTLKTPMSSKDKELFNKAWDGISEKIVSEKNLDDIDMVSGATVSSAGIIEAVENALSGQTKSTDNSTAVYAPEGISLYARVYPIVTVKDGEISDIRIVPVSGTDTDTLNAFADEIKQKKSVRIEYPLGAEDDAYNIASLIDQILYGKGVLADE
jgi:uncharacterized protein with FMN-binding domain